MLERTKSVPTSIGDNNPNYLDNSLQHSLLTQLPTSKIPDVGLRVVAKRWTAPPSNLWMSAAVSLIVYGSDFGRSFLNLDESDFGRSSP